MRYKENDAITKLDYASRNSRVLQNIRRTSITCHYLSVDIARKFNFNITVVF